MRYRVRGERSPSFARSSMLVRLRQSSTGEMRYRGEEVLTHGRETEILHPGVLRVLQRSGEEQQQRVVHREQGTVREGRAGAGLAIHPRRRTAAAEDQLLHRRGSQAVRRIPVPHLPRHPVLAGQEPVQDGGRNPLLAREGTGAGGNGARLLSPHALRRDDGPLRRLASHAPTLKKIRDRIVEEPDAWKKVLRSRVSVVGDSIKRPPPGYDP